MDIHKRLPKHWKPLHAAASGELVEMMNMLNVVSPHHGIESFLLTEILVERLGDLTRPSSRDFWARWLASMVGMDVGPTAPRWIRSHEEQWPLWALVDDHGGMCAFYDIEGRFPWGNYEVSIWYAIPSISKISDPAEALRHVLMHIDYGTI